MHAVRPQGEGQDGPSQPTGFDKNRGAIFGRRGPAAAVRSKAEDERPSPAASNPTLSATFLISRLQSALRALIEQRILANIDAERRPHER
jgi:hypothetical protein